MIVCGGEALIDMLPRESRDGEEAFAPHPGGAVFNTAVALGRLGAPVGLIAGLSRDFFGDMLRRRLEESGVEDGLAVLSDRPTTLAFLRLEDGQARYAFYDENTAGRMLRPEDMPPLPEAAQALFVGGISLMGEPCGSAFEALAMREAGRRVVMLDPNIRPGFITDEAACRARLERMIAGSDIVKLSDEDLSWLARGAEPAAAAQALLERGPRLVLVTEGACGAVGYAGSLEVRVAAPKVRVVDTVGAGDTFNAGVLAALHEAGALNRAALEAPQARVLEEALFLGVRAAAVTVSRAGASPPWREEL